MHALLVATALLLERGHLLASPYLGAPRFDLERGFEAGAALDDAEAASSAPDDTPTTTARIPALQCALAAIAAARFAEAAQALAAFAAAEPRAREAGWALRRAYQYWRALGRDDEAQAARREYEMRHARSEPAAAALFHWGHFADLGDDEARAEHARRYLAEHAPRGPRDVAVVAEAELAAALWRSACPDAWHSLCVTRRRARLKDACRPDTADLFEARPRYIDFRRAALHHAAAALHAGERLELAGVAPWRRKALRAALGQAALLLADDALEELITVEFPARLNFFVEEWKRDADVPRWRDEYRMQVRRRADSERRMLRYWKQYGARQVRTERWVLEVAKQRSGPSILTLSMHIAVVYARRRDDWALKAELPNEFLTEDAVPFVNCLDDRLLPLLEEASDLLAMCARLARSRDYFSPELAVCFEGFGEYTHAQATAPLVELFGPSQ